MITAKFFPNNSATLWVVCLIHYCTHMYSDMLRNIMEKREKSKKINKTKGTIEPHWSALSIEIDQWTFKQSVNMTCVILKGTWASSSVLQIHCDFEFLQTLKWMQMKWSIVKGPQGPEKPQQTTEAAAVWRFNVFILYKKYYWIGNIELGKVYDIRQFI